MLLWRDFIGAEFDAAGAKFFYLRRFGIKKWTAVIVIEKFPLTYSIKSSLI
jgi:hypothetical protein